MAQTNQDLNGRLQVRVQEITSVLRVEIRPFSDKLPLALMTIVYCKLNTYRRDPPSSKSRPPEAPCLNVLGSVHLVSLSSLNAPTTTSGSAAA